MRKEYDLKKLKAKRRGMLPGLKAGEPPPAKVRITIALDDDVVEYFKTQSTRPGACLTKPRSTRHCAGPWGPVGPMPRFSKPRFLRTTGSCGRLRVERAQRRSASRRPEQNNKIEHRMVARTVGPISAA